MVTTNFERSRALHWGAAILSELLIEPTAPVKFMEIARRLVPAFPGAAVIDALSHDAPIKLTSAQVEAIWGTRALLEQLSAADVAVTVDGRDVLQATLRHFPLTSEENAGFLYWPIPPAPP